MVYSHGFDDRLRAMLEDRADLKSQLRAMLQLPLFELGNLIQHGVYHPAFHGSFELDPVHEALMAARGTDAGESLAEFATGDTEISSDEEASEAFRRILNSRTRAATREKLGAQLDQFVRRQCGKAVEIYRSLQSPVTTP